MINVIKMDLYRMVKNKATWLIFLASMLKIGRASCRERV